MTLLINILLGFYVFVALLMILVILMQRPKSEGLGAAFGGGVTENIFGAQTTNVLTKFTSWLAAIFFLLTFALSILYAHKSNTSNSPLRELVKDLTPTPSPAPESASPTPSPSALAEADISPTPNATQSPEAKTSAEASTPAPEPTAEPAMTPASISTEVAVTPSPATTPEPSVSASTSAAPTNTPGTHHRRRRR